MMLLEFYRLRRSFSIWLALFVVLAAIFVASVIGSSHITAIEVHNGHTTVVHPMAMQGSKAASIPLAVFFVIAAFLVLPFATGRGTSLNREWPTLARAVTSRVSRGRRAQAYVATHALAVVALWVGALVVIAISLTLVGWWGKVHAAGGGVLSTIVLGFGVAFVWYGIVQLATASLGKRAGSFAGWSWLVFWGILAVVGITGDLPIHAWFGWLRYIDPLYYAQNIGDAPRGHLSANAHGETYVSVQMSAFVMPMWARIVIVWAAGAATLAGAIALWRRREA